MSKQTSLTKKYTKFDPKRINFTDLEENARSKGQKIAYVRYRDEKKGDQTLLLQTPQIELNTYGIPRKGEYYNDDKQRSFIKVPLDTENSESGILYNKLSELDTLLESDEMKIKIFGSLKKAKGYKYQTIVRENAPTTIEDNSDSDESDGEGSKNETTQQQTYPRPPYFKAKLNLDYESGNITTKVFKLSPNSTREDMSITTLDQLETLVTFRSSIRMIVMPNKLWALKTFDGKRYGLSFKIMHLEVEPVERSSLKQFFDNDAFVDSDDDDDDNDNDEAETVVQTTKSSTNLDTSALDGSDDDDDDDSDSNSNEAAEDNAGSASENSASENSDSDSEDEAPPPKKKTAGKNTKKKMLAANN